MPSEEPTGAQPGHRILEFAFLCDAASDKGGALDALGIGTTLIGVSRLPAMHQVTLVLRVAWTGGPVKPGATSLAVDITDPSGSSIAGLRGDFGVDDEPGDPVHLRHPEIPVGANLIFPIPLQLNEYGLHQVEIRLDNDIFNPLPLKVIRSEG